MDNFTFSYPAKVYFGKGSAEQAFEKEHSRIGNPAYYRCLYPGSLQPQTRKISRG